MNLSGEIKAMMAEIENIRKMYHQILDQLGGRELTEEERIAKNNLESLLIKAEAFEQSCAKQGEVQLTGLEAEIDEETEAEFEMLIAMAIGDVIGEMPDEMSLEEKKTLFEATPSDQTVNLLERIQQLLSRDENRKMVQTICMRTLQELKPAEVDISSRLIPSLLEMIRQGQVNRYNGSFAQAGAFGGRDLLATLLAPLAAVHLANRIDKADVSQVDLDQIVDLTGYQGSEQEFARINKLIQKILESFPLL